MNTYGQRREGADDLQRLPRAAVESVKETRRRARPWRARPPLSAHHLQAHDLEAGRSNHRGAPQLPEDGELIVCGDGPEQDAWEELARSMGLEGRVHFRGNVAHDLVPLYIRAADIFVLYSRYEGLSHTLIEVQTLGTMAVASAGSETQRPFKTARQGVCAR